MTTKQLRDNVAVQWYGYGTYLVKIKYRGEVYSCTSYNSLAFDRIRYSGGYAPNTEIGFYTYKAAFKAFFDECKRKNGLGEYMYG